MSLKSIHIVVMLTAIATLTFFGVYFMASYRVWAILSLSLAALLVPYLFWFLNKLKKNHVV